MQNSIVLRIGRWTVCDFEGELCLKGYGLVENSAEMAVLLVKGAALPIVAATSHCRAMHPELVSILQRFSKNLAFDNDARPGTASCRIVSARGLEALRRTVKRLNAEASKEERQGMLKRGCDFDMEERYGFALLEEFAWFNVNYNDYEGNVPRRVRIADTTVDTTTVDARMGDYDEWAVYCADYAQVVALNDVAEGGVAERLFRYKHCLDEGERYKDLLVHENESDCFASSRDIVKQVRRLTAALPRIATLDDAVDDAENIAHKLPHPSNDEPEQDVDDIYATVFEWIEGEDGSLRGRGITEHLSAAFIDVVPSTGGGKEDLKHIPAAPCRVNVRAKPTLIECNGDCTLMLHYTIGPECLICCSPRYSYTMPDEDVIELVFDNHGCFTVDQDGFLLQDLLV